MSFCCLMCENYCLICAYVREDNLRALASGISPVHKHKHTISFNQHTCVIIHVHFVNCVIFEV